MELFAFTINRTPENWATALLAAVLVIFATSILLFGLSRIPSNMRRPLVGLFVFISGLFWILDWALPRSRVQEGATTSVKTLIPIYPYDYQEVINVLVNVSQVMSGIILALGVLSILRVHFKKVFKADRDAFFSIVLLGSMAAMIVIGLWDWIATNREAVGMSTPEENKTIHMAFSIVFLDMLQILDAAMFSLIAFFILSAAYRAFRVRSIEATIMMAVALIVLLGFIPLAMALTAGLPAEGFLSNFRIENMKTWILLNMSTPALRAIDLGLGLGLLAMALRILLGIEKGVAVD
ncbi:MAG: hypothetical protein KatS3mg015_1782 [Fimbriimonadales bacterium]|nr:MAG: hypothetical protein KatS3mg015_1782 [Fimbriimonadales bacterium]